MIYEIEEFNTKIVGVTFEGRQQVIQVLERLKVTNKEAMQLFLKREPDNKYDPFAIAVFAKYYDEAFMSEITRQIGYLKSELAVILSGDMDKGYSFEVLDFETTGGYNKTRGVNIKILRKEANMPTITALDLLAKRGNRSADYLRMSQGAIMTLRFLKPIKEAFVEAMYSITMPDGKTRERFASPQFLNGVGDDSIKDLAREAGFEPWIKLVLPVIDRADGKVKLFKETAAVYKKLQLFEQTPENEAEKTIKLGSLTNADIQVVQQGKGKERQISAFPVPGTFRPLNDAEKKLLETAPNPKDGLRVLTNDEIKRILAVAVGAQQAAASQTMTVEAPKKNGPFD
jgi:hypothetical protein